MILSIVQTADGYLWLGSLSGLFRFDGVRFEQYQPRFGGNFPSNEIASLLALPDGGLWIGYRQGGASLLKDDRTTNYGEREGLPSGRLAALVQDQSGTIWAAIWGGGLARFEDGRWKVVGAEWNFPGKSAQTAFVDRQGTLWVVTNDTVLFLPRGARSFQPTGEDISVVTQIAEAPDGKLWLAETPKNVRPMRFPDRQAPVPEIRAGSQAILFDDAGALWATSVGDGIVWVAHPEKLTPGLVRQNSKAVEMFSEKDGLTDDVVLSVFEDRENNIWVGTPKGLESFRKSNLVPMVLPPGYQRFAIVAGDSGAIWIGSQSRAPILMQGNKLKLTVHPDRYVGCGYRNPNGEVWLGGVGDGFHIRAGTVSYWQMPIAHQDRSAVVDAITQDDSGRVWIATAGQGIWTLKDNRWKKYENAVLPSENIESAYTDFRGRVWFGYENSLVAVLDHDRVRVFSRNDGIATGAVKVIRGRNENVWIGGESGVAIFQQGRFRMLDAAETKPFSGVSGIVETANGSLWLSESRGIIQVPSLEVQAALRDPAYKVRYQLFDYANGLPGAIQQVATPTAIEGTDGRLSFATVAGLVTIDPGNLIENKLPPGVLVRSVSAGDQQYLPGPNVRLPALTTNIHVDYTALSLSVPEHVLFRYKLDGFDKDWQDAGTRREAFYTNLPPRNYTFRVKACNNSGVWNEAGASMSFSVEPEYYQTWWFRGGGVGAVLALLGVFYYLWLEELQRRFNIGLEARVAERTRIARELHDTLLQNVQGLILKIDAVAKSMPKEASARQAIEKTLDHADQVMAEGRERVRTLRSGVIAYGQLPKAFQRVAEEAAPNRTSTFKTVVEGSVLELNPIVREESYSIGREAIINALTHSEGLNIEVEITYDPRQFRVCVRDDGRGIDPAILEKGGREDHWGLQGMRERASKIGGQLEVWSRPRAGTEVALMIPGHTAYRDSSARPKDRWFRWFSSSDGHQP